MIQGKLSWFLADEQRLAMDLNEKTKAKQRIKRKCKQKGRQDHLLAISFPNALDEW